VGEENKFLSGRINSSPRGGKRGAVWLKRLFKQQEVQAENDNAI
jgi:hypothetical protein